MHTCITRRPAYRVVLILALLAAALPHARLLAQEKGIGGVVSIPVDGKPKMLYQDSYALIIGVNRYPNGSAFRSLRKKLHRCEREYLPEVRDYRAGDLEACVALLNRWQESREEVCSPVFDYGYTRAALEHAARIPGLVGIVLEVAGRIGAFAFGGPAAQGLGNFFLLKSDPDVAGLAETARLALVERLVGCELINDAGDLQRPGLAQHKAMFRPVAFVPTFKIAVGA